MVDDLLPPESIAHGLGVTFRPHVPNGVGVLTVAGSSGRLDDAQAQLFAATGCVAETMTWFGGPGQSAGPYEVPLETFLDRAAALRRECDHVGFVGTSCGAEGVLAAAAQDGGVLVDAVAPSSVVWCGIRPDGTATSHWTFGGQPLPYVPFSERHWPDDETPSFLDLYLSSFEQAPERVRGAATIAVERIPHVVAVAGGDDQVWPSAEFAARIARRRSEHGLETVIVADEAAGHRTILPGEPVATGGRVMARGGSERADRRLGASAWSAVEVLLAELGGARVTRG